MKTFIIGIAGGVGRRVAQQLLAQGDEVDGLVRNQEKAEELAQSGISTSPGDLVAMSVPELADALRGSDAIVFSAGAGGKDGPDATRQVDGEGPPKLAAAAEMAGVRRFVLVSVFPEAWRERERTDDFENYIKEKKNADTKMVLTGLDWVLVRPSALMDEPGTGQVDLGLAKIHEEISRDDVATTIVEVLGEPGVNHTILEVTAGTTPIREAVMAMAR
ncbi:MAG: hypothetical protein AVDCRST_MAG91-61 [uncultured Sphingomonadaceae bacterium]|uniref:NAD(P)-binding domain-containing protein n=1 Tax=uncultured Sphingomonadaceae bacterium TaxID=169976 RepID=A0A6J4RUJ6_9SPHN|nr:MAG: hypothetical protein AVDCRST_MAG91-61 [uncultured Sphingomonadaceae bacterium]